MWVWRADHGGLVGHVDDAHFTGPKEPTRAQATGGAPYTGGFGVDDGDACAADNVQRRPDGSFVPLRLPVDPDRVEAALGQIRETPEVSDDDGSTWWLDLADTVPFSKEAEQTIPVGAIVPGVVSTCRTPGQETDVRGVARWAAGRWTLEVQRRLDTRSDQDIRIESGVVMWVAAFDHAATRHTRHLRPITLELL